MRNNCAYTANSSHERSGQLLQLRVGDGAKNAFHSNPQNTVFDAKCLMSRKMDDPDIVRA